MPVGALVADAHHARETSYACLVRGFALQGTIGTGTQLEVGVLSVVEHLARNDVHHATHGVAAIHHAGRTAYDLDTLGHHRLIGIRDGVSHEAGILRLSVDKHEQLGTAAHAAHHHRAGRSGAHAVAHEAAARDKEAGHLLGERGQHAGTVLGRQFFAADHSDAHGQQAGRRLAAGAGDHDFPDLCGIGNAFVKCPGLHGEADNAYA